MLPEPAEAPHRLAIDLAQRHRAAIAPVVAIAEPAVGTRVGGAEPLFGDRPTRLRRGRGVAAAGGREDEEESENQRRACRHVGRVYRTRRAARKPRSQRRLR